MANEEPSIVIHNLDVQFDVQGDDRQVFATLFQEHFEKFMRRWWHNEQDRAARDRLSTLERSLGDRAHTRGGS